MTSGMWSVASKRSHLFLADDRISDSVFLDTDVYLYIPFAKPINKLLSIYPVPSVASSPKSPPIVEPGGPWPYL